MVSLLDGLNKKICSNLIFVCSVASISSVFKLPLHVFPKLIYGLSQIVLGQSSKF